MHKNPNQIKTKQKNPFDNLFFFLSSHHCQKGFELVNQNKKRNFIC